MGAGSTRIMAEERSKFPAKEGKKPCKYLCTSRSVVKGTEHYHFLNTGKPYLIEKCQDCKREYVREL